MSNQSINDTDFNGSFDAMFREAEQSDAYWVSKAKFRFTEEMISQMEAKGITKSVFAQKLGVNPAQITRLCSGLNNFTIDTMVRVARSLECEFLTRLQPAGTESMWINVLTEEPIRQYEWPTSLDGFKTLATEQYETKCTHVVGTAA